MNNDTQVILFYIQRSFISPVNHLFISYSLSKSVISYLFSVVMQLSMHENEIIKEFHVDANYH